MATPSIPSTPAAKEPLFTRPFLLSAASHFFHALAFNLYLHLSGFLEKAGASADTIGWIFGATGAAAIVARPPMGRIMDQRGRVVIIRGGGALHVIVCLLYCTVTAAGPWVTGVRIAHGIAEAMLFTSLFAFASDIVPKSRRFEGIALFGVSGMLPVSLGAQLGDLLLARAGGPSVAAYRQLFIASAVLSCAAFLLSLPLREPAREGADEQSQGMLAAFRKPDLGPLWLAGLVFATCLSASFTFFATFVMREKIGSAGLYFSCYSIAAISLRILAAKLPERVGPKRVLFPAMVSFALGLTLLSFARSPLHIGLAGVLSGLGHGYTFPILLGLVVSRARASDRGASLAIFTALFDAGALLGNPVFGNVLAATRSYRAMFGTAAVVMVTGTLLFAGWDRGRR